MALIPYNKPHATGLQRVAHLRTRGLYVPRPNVAASKIDLIGYERLRIYFRSRRQRNLPNRPFRPGTSYADILRIYKCDEHLREAVFRAVGQFELLFRNAISEALSLRYGSHPHENHAAFKTPFDQIGAFQLLGGIYQKSKDQRAKHYKNKYGPPAIPPIWTMKELFTFGSSVRFYKHLEAGVRTAVAKEFGVPSDAVFTNWLEAFVDLRNICAHHDRLFNRSFQKQPQTLSRYNVPTGPRNKLKAILECLEHVLHAKSGNRTVLHDVSRILNRFPEVSNAEAGF